MKDKLYLAGVGDLDVNLIQGWKHGGVGNKVYGSPGAKLAKTTQEMRRALGRG